MEPTSEYRRNLILTWTLLAVCTAALFTSSFELYAVSSWLWSLAAGILLCVHTNRNPLNVPWKFLRTIVGHEYETRFRWGELNIHRPYFDISLRLSEGYNKPGDLLIIAFVFFSIYLRLPSSLCQRLKKPNPKSDMECEFGFYTIDSSIVWRWNCRYWSWDIPFFSYKWHSTEILSLDGKRTVFIERASDRRDWKDRHTEEEAAKAANSESHPYTYTRRNGEVQHRLATLHVSRMTHTRKWFPFLKLVRTSIWVEFNEQIGEEVDTWKGGTTGCGYSLLPGERPVDALRRMERERKFERGHRRPKEKTPVRDFFRELVRYELFKLECVEQRAHPDA